MVSLRSLVRTGTAALGLLAVDAGNVNSCPSNSPLSCHNTTTVANSCCTNTPGGLLLQTQFWDTSPSTGPSDSWTVHGLWPDNCDGTYQQFCDPKREYTNITQILKAAGQTSLLAYMDTYWKDEAGNDETFWEHEWNKHGTCISTLDPKCYINYKPQDEVVNFFNRCVNLFKTLPSYKFLQDAGIVPSSSKTYKLADIQAALKKGHGFVPTIQCTNSNELDEIWYYYNTRGTVAGGQFVAAAATTPGDCPATVKYLPKNAGAAPTKTTTSSARTTASSSTSAPTSTGPAFTGKGYLDVSKSGAKDGCLISGGTWYTTGTCATYTATSVSGGGFTLSSSKGACAVDASSKLFSCSSAVSSPTVFDSDSGALALGGSPNFSAEGAASGSTQEKVYADEGAVDLTITWQSV